MEYIYNWNTQLNHRKKTKQSFFFLKFLIVLNLECIKMFILYIDFYLLSENELSYNEYITFAVELLKVINSARKQQQQQHEKIIFNIHKYLTPLYPFFALSFICVIGTKTFYMFCLSVWFRFKICNGFRLEINIESLFLE